MPITTTAAATRDNCRIHYARRRRKQPKMAESHLSVGSEEEQQGITSIITTTAPIGDHWEVQYARFFHAPSVSSSAGAGAHHPSLVSPVHKPKGSWISSFTSVAYLKLLATNHSDTSRSVILTVTLLDKVTEEHYISKLHFTWPQVSCLTGFPPRGSKVVFMSYKDQVGQIQKFVVRFVSTDETDRFINFIKEIFGHERIDSGISKSKTSSHSDIIPGPTQDLEPITSSVDYSQDVYRPIQDWSTISSPTNTYIQQNYLIENHDVNQNSNSMENIFSQDTQKLSAFPPSFTSLLMNCFPMAEKELISTDPDEANLKKEIMKYLEDSSFQETLSKVQKVITEFEDELLF